MDLNEKIEYWKKQLKQAKEYGLFFDRETAKEMIETIEHLQHERDIFKRGFIEATKLCK